MKTLIFGTLILSASIAYAADQSQTQSEMLPDTIEIVCNDPVTKNMDIETGTQIKITSGTVSVYRTAKGTSDQVFVRNMSGDCSVDPIVSYGLM